MVRCRAARGGLPVGNGTMGTLVWTSPSAVKTQINRVDVFANDSYSNSFNERHLDYGYACGLLDIDFAGFSEDVFDGGTKQHLKLYTAEGEIRATKLTAAFLPVREWMFLFSRWMTKEPIVVRV